nr:hypothetical protein [Urinicoccus massiliensis]
MRPILIDINEGWSLKADRMDIRENAGELTDEEIKILIEEVTKAKEFKETLRIIRNNIKNISFQMKLW